MRPVILHVISNPEGGESNDSVYRFELMPMAVEATQDAGEALTEIVRSFLADKLASSNEVHTLSFWAKDARIENLAEWSLKYRDSWTSGRTGDGIRRRMAAASSKAWRLAAQHALEEDRVDPTYQEIIDSSLPTRHHAVSLSDGIGVSKRLMVRGGGRKNGPAPSNKTPSLLVDWAIPEEDSNAAVRLFLAWEEAYVGVGESQVHASRPVLTGLANLVDLLQTSQWSYLLARYSEEEGETWLQNLALAWLRWKREEERSVPMVVRRAIATSSKGDLFTPLPLALEHASYLFGGPVVVNGENYAREPGQSSTVVGQLLKSRAVDIVPEEWTKSPRQLAFDAIELDLSSPVDRDVEEYLIVTATQAAASSLDLPAMAAKLVPLMFATSPMDGRPVHGTLEDAASLLYPNLTGRNGRKHKARDLTRIGAALAAMRRLRLIETRENGRGHSYSLFSIAYDLSTDPDAEVEWALDPILAARMQGGGNERGGGFFLVNFSRLMAMDIKNPRLFALYLRLAGLWNSAKDFRQGKFRPELFKAIDVDQLAALTNAMPRNAAEWLAGKRKDQTSRIAYYQTRQRLISDLEELRAHGLVGDLNLLNPHGKPWSVQPQPDDDLKEAYSLASRRGRQVPVDAPAPSIDLSSSKES